MWPAFGTSPAKRAAGFGFSARLYAGGELLWLAHAADVHEVDFRLVVEEVVVQGGDLQAVLERRVHRRRHFILEDDRVAHDHRAMARGGEGGPRAETGEWLQGHPVHLDGDVFPRPGDAHDAIGAGRGFHSARRADGSGVQPMGGLRLRPNRRAGDDQGDTGQHDYRE
jgi:hypothetical protein